MNTHEKIKTLLNTMHDDDFECKFTGQINTLFDYVEEQQKKDERAKKVEELKVYQERYIHKLSYGRRSPYDKKYHLEKIAQLKKELEELV